MYKQTRKNIYVYRMLFPLKHQNHHREDTLLQTQTLCCGGLIGRLSTMHKEHNLEIVAKEQVEVQDTTEMLAHVLKATFVFVLLSSSLSSGVFKQLSV